MRALASQTTAFARNTRTRAARAQPALAAGMEAVKQKVALLAVMQLAARRPAAERWTRPCARTSDCTSGGVCARAGAASICRPAMDPWLHLGRSCPGGTHPIEVRAVDAREGGAWQACVAACDTAGGCPGALACDPGRSCLPVATAAHGGSHG